MMNRRSKSQHPLPASTLMQIAVDVDLVRFKKSLLQIGFFGANDARDKNRASRRIEQVIVRNGSKIELLQSFADQSPLDFTPQQTGTNLSRYQRSSARSA